MSTPTSALSLITLLGFLAAAISAGATGALFKPGAWYEALSKPPWTPPNWLFPVAWTLLYVALTFAVWRVTNSGSTWVLPGIAFWCWQIVLNALWSPVFFGLRRMDAALVIILILWLVVAATALIFFQASAVAGAIMLVYLVWISFATALNFSVLRRNPGLSRA